MKGITQERINIVKNIDLIQYLKDNHPDRFRVRKGGELVDKQDKSFVVYQDHAYVYNEVKHPYKDSIYVEEMVSGCSFMEAVEHIETWIAKRKMPAPTTQPKAEEKEAISDDGFMFIPDGIDELMDIQAPKGTNKEEPKHTESK